MSFLTTRRSLKPEDWVPIVKKCIWQVSYRVLGQISIHCPIQVASKAVQILCEKEGMGKCEWLIPDRVMVWYDVPVDHAMTVNIYVWGSPTLQRNTVFTRIGFWRLYLLESFIKTVGKPLTFINRIFRPS